mmetsp:Transcript_11121/g.28886  ORF Transcript_11121/g.28886 Transcript_11121/m.28886 type:complete len:249 (-) Transcript_11121:1164-1910(-)
MFQTKMHPSSPVDTSWRSSGLKRMQVMVPECPAPSISSLFCSKSKTLTTWSLPPHPMNRPEWDSVTVEASSGRFTAATGSGSRRSQKVRRRSCPTETTCTWSAASETELTPPIRCRSDAILFSLLRSHDRMLRSRLAVRQWASSEKTQMLVTAELCSLRWATMSLCLMSQTLTSPSSPPVTMNRWLCDTARAVTPPRCTSLIFHSISPVSASKHRTKPSLQPLRRHSRANAMQWGCPPSLHIPLQRTL